MFLLIISSCRMKRLPLNRRFNVNEATNALHAWATNLPSKDHFQTQTEAALCHVSCTIEKNDQRTVVVCHGTQYSRHYTGTTGQSEKTVKVVLRR